MRKIEKQNHKKSKRREGKMKHKRIKEMILYVSDKSKNDPAFGSTKLNKILFTADFYFYGLTGRSITNCKYIHLDRGPAPKGMMEILNELVTEDKIEIKETSYFGFNQKRVIPRVIYNLSSFSDDEKTFVDAVIKQFESWNGSELTNWTHSLLPWRLTSKNEEIPYHSIFMLQDIPVEADGLSWGKQQLKEIRGKREAA
ncbi:DUF4065 domain-containing protein [bacterium]|nr:DUF4065 domain-containing protein [bacterium]